MPHGGLAFEVLSERLGCGTLKRHGRNLVGVVVVCWPRCAPYPVPSFKVFQHSSIFSHSSSWARCGWRQFWRQIVTVASVHFPGDETHRGSTAHIVSETNCVRGPVK